MFRRGRVRVFFTDAGDGQVFAVASVDGLEDAAHTAAIAYDAIAEILFARDLAIVHERIFGSLLAESAVLAVRRRALGEKSAHATCAPTYVQARPSWGEGLAGLILHAVALRGVPGAVTTFWDDGIVVGRSWTQGRQKHLVLQNLDGLDARSFADNSPAAQVTRLLDRAFFLATLAGIRPEGLARTWFYLDDIVQHYATFNRLRNDVFADKGLLARGDGRHRLPASTAIGVSNSRRAVAVLDLVAVGEDAGIERLSSPSQPEAFSYGSAFSRATVLHEPGVRILHLSGTAAIDESGGSVFAKDADAQIRTSLDRIQALLSLRGASLFDVAAATVFLKHASDSAAFDRALCTLDLGELPCVVVVADVCREELLFELDAEVVLPPAARGS